MPSDSSLFLIFIASLLVKEALELTDPITEGLLYHEQQVRGHFLRDEMLQRESSVCFRQQEHI